MAASANAATFSWNSSTIGQITEVGSFDSERSTIDVTVMGSNDFRSFIPGRRNANFSVSLLLTHSAHTNLLADYKAGTERAFLLDFRDGRVAGSGFITSLSMGAQQDSASTLSLSVQVTTDLTFSATT